MQENLSDLAQELGRWMAERCTDGMLGHFDDELLEAFPEAGRKAMSLALAELEEEGLITLSHVLGPHLPRVRTTVEDRVSDTKALAEGLGWAPRRMNSAICYLQRAGVIEARQALASRPWRAVQLLRTDRTLRFARNNG